MYSELEVPKDVYCVSRGFRLNRRLGLKKAAEDPHAYARE